MLFKLLLLFTVLPFVELGLLFYLSGLAGWYFTLVMVLVTGVVGASLARRQGFNVWQRIQRDLSQGRMPADSLLDALLILLAGAVLITPGVLTDAVGFLLLVPPCRRVAKRWIMRRFRSRFEIRSGSYQYEAEPRDTIIDARVIDPTDEDDPPET